MQLKKTRKRQIREIVSFIIGCLFMVGLWYLYADLANVVEDSYRAADVLVMLLIAFIGFLASVILDENILIYAIPD